MIFDKLRKLKPEIKNVNEVGGRLDPRFRGITTQVPAKEVANTRNNMDLLRMYTHGILKFEDIGPVCGNCMNYYPDEKAPLRGRCRAKGFMQVHAETAADTRYNYTHPADGTYFQVWPACPYYLSKERLSRR